MKNRGFHYLLVLLSFIVAIGLACKALSPSSPTSAPAPTTAPVVTQSLVSTEAPGNNSSATEATTSSDLVTFTDKNKYFAIDVPANWTHETSSGEHYYIDTFTSPEKGAVIESIVYDDGQPFTGTDNGRFALQLLNQNYSKTGSEGDIRITEEKQQSDGSDRLTWTSKAGGYSGISFFEVRNKTTFLMFTVDWGNDYKDTYFDLLGNVITSYRAP